MRKVLVFGASGATGKELIKLLLQKSIEVVAIVRDPLSLAHLNDYQASLKIVKGNISELSKTDLKPYVSQCDAVLSCLGHNLSFRGIYGQPRLLVTDAIKSIVETIEARESDKKVKVVLMNTTGNSNRDIPEKPPLSQQVVVSLIRYLLPPHVDNEKAADHLRLHVGQDNQAIQWVVVRPDGLINQDNVSSYEVYESPIRNPIFDAGSTSRINVADFMSQLIIDEDLWAQWKGKMPVIYNKE